MDSLLASYASSDDEDESPPTVTATAAPPPPASKPLSPALPSPRLFSSLPPPKSLPPLADASKPSPSSLFSVLPPPKSHRPSPIDPIATADDASKSSPSLFSSLPPPKPSPASSLFSSLPPPKPSPLFSSLPPPKPANPPSIPPPKTVVKFTPPVPAPLTNHDSDSDDDTRKRKPNKSSVAGGDGGPRKSSSLLLPAPKNTLCLAPALGGGAAPRRSTLQADTDTPSPDLANSAAVPDPVEFVPEAVTGYEDYGGYDGSWAGGSGDLQAGVSGGEGSGWVPSYGGGEGYMGDWSEGPVVTTAPDLADMERAAGKRARRGVPMEILEVKQDELMKNRPREDQHKVTGVAFGPAYQAVSSSKGKPSKLHKRKHQIGSLYFDMKSKEAELAERRSRSFLTKAETQAKYGW